MTKADQSQRKSAASPARRRFNGTNQDPLKEKAMSLIRRRDRVCRALFGAVDHDQLRLELKLKLKEISEQDSRRWNFNFQTECPLPGRYLWEEVPADGAAAFHLESARLKAAAETSDSDDISENSAVLHLENCSGISNALKHPAEVTPRKRMRKSRTGTKMTDFFVKRRRTSESECISSPFLTRLSETAACKTIR